MKLNFITTPKKPISGVLHLSFKDKNVNWFVGEKLRIERPCGCTQLSFGSEQTALYYSIYNALQSKLDEKQIATCSNFNIGDGTFNISLTSTLTNIRKLYAVVKKVLNSVLSCYQFYQKNMVNLCAKSVKSDFLYCVDNIGDCTITVMASDKIITMLKSKMIASDFGKIPKVNGTKPKSMDEKQMPSSYTLLKGGWETPIASAYLTYLKVPCKVSSDGIIVYDDKILKSKKSQITKSNVDNRLTKLYEKQGFKDFHINILWALLSDGHHLPSGKISKADVSKAIMKIIG